MRRMLLLMVVVLACALPCAGQEADAFSFAVFGDCRPGSAPYSPVMAAIATDISEQGVAFVVGTGDYIEGSSNQAVVRAQFQRFFEAIAPLQSRKPTPVAFAPGNHDISRIPANEAIFEEYFGHLYFSFNFGQCHFIILDTDGAHTAGTIEAAQMQWLRQDLAAHQAAVFTFVALHQPLFPVDGHVGSSLDVVPVKRDALHALFIQQGVDCVFAGHEHLYNYQLKDGIHYFITGGAGAPLYTQPERGGFYHYLLVKVEGTRFEVTVRRITAG